MKDERHSSIAFLTLQWPVKSGDLIASDARDLASRKRLSASNAWRAAEGNRNTAESDQRPDHSLKQPSSRTAA